MLFASFLVLAAVGYHQLNLIATEPSVRSVDTVVLGPKKEDGHQLKKEENAKTFTSEVHKAEFQFNAIAPHWKETNASNPTRTLELRTSLNDKDWTEWFEVEAGGPLRDDDPHPDRMFTESPIFVEGRYFQYRLTLKRLSAADPTPQVYDLKINQIDSTESQVKQFIKGFAGIGAKKVNAANGDLNITSRAAWGSPDPYGDKYRGTDRHWTPSYSPVSQVFVHHTVTPTYVSDASAQVRAIWEFHTHTRGWGDIGYNYLIDQNGGIYQGRSGGDNVDRRAYFRIQQGIHGRRAIGLFPIGPDVRPSQWRGCRYAEPERHERIDRPFVAQNFEL